MLSTFRHLRVAQFDSTNVNRLVVLRPLIDSQGVASHQHGHQGYSAEQLGWEVDNDGSNSRVHMQMPTVVTTSMSNIHL